MPEEEERGDREPTGADGVETPPPAPFEPPSSLGGLIDELEVGASVRYDAEGEVARGGMGAILRVRDRKLHRDVAMKVILDEEGRVRLRDEHGSLTPMVQRFLEEAQVTAQLDHPGVVPIHELGLDAEGRLFFTMKLVRGNTLGEVFTHVREGTRDWTLTRALEVFVRVCDTLAFAHSKGVIHRDLKPANVMVGGFGEVYVMDWGLAKALGERAHGDDEASSADLSLVRTVRSDDPSDSGDAQLTQVGQVLGTPSYMPPEQAMGRADDLDGRADLFAVGAMLYELLAGHAPYQEPGSQPTPRDVLLASVAGPPTPLRRSAHRVPPELVAIVEKAMARERERRYDTARDLARDLRRFLDGRVVRAYRTGALIELHKWVMRNKAVAFLGTAAILLLAAGLAATSVFSVRAKRGWDTARQEQRVAAEERATALAIQDAAERRGYQAELAAIQGDLRSGDPPAAEARLAMLDEERSGWEVDHIRSLVDQSITRMRGQLLGFQADGRVVLGERNGGIVVVDILSGRSDELLPAPPEAREGRRVWYARDGSHRGPCRFAAQCVGSKEGLHVRILEIATGRVLRKMLSKTGMYFATLAHPPRLALLEGGRLLVLDTETGRQVAAVDWPLGGGALDWSPDGKSLLVAVGGAGSVLLLDGATLATLRTLETPYPQAARFDPSGRRFAVPRLLSAAVYDVEGGDEGVVWEASDKSGRVVDVLWRDDGRVFATLSEDGSITLRDGEDGHVFGEFLSMSRNTASGQLAFCPSGSMLAVAFADDVSLWPVSEAPEDFDNPVEGYVLRGHLGYVYPVAFSPDGSLIASGGWDGRVAGETGCLRIWDAATGAQIAALGESTDLVMSLAWFPDGRRLLVVDGTGRRRLHYVDLIDGSVSDPFEMRLESAVLSPDGTRIVAGRGISAVPCILDPRRPETPPVILDDVPGAPVGTPHDMSPDGRTFVTLAEGAVFIGDAETGETVMRLDGFTKRFWSAAFSPDGERLVVTAEDQSAHVFEVATGKELVVLRQQADVIGCTWSPDGTRLVAGGRDRRIHLYDTSTWDELAVLSGHDSYVYSLAFSPDGKRLASGSGDRTVRIWDTVPFGVRYRARLERGRLLRDLEPRIRSLLDEEGDAHRVAERLRADAELQGRPLEVALQVLLTESVRRARDER